MHLDRQTLIMCCYAGTGVRPTLVCHPPPRRFGPAKFGWVLHEIGFFESIDSQSTAERSPFLLGIPVPLARDIGDDLLLVVNLFLMTLFSHSRMTHAIKLRAGGASSAYMFCLLRTARN